MDLGHAYQFLAESHLLLCQKDFDRTVALCCRSLKAVKQVMLALGDRALAWAHTGLPEMRATGRARRGGTHPVEASAGMAYLREMRTVEEWCAGPRSRPEGGGVGSGG